MSVYANAEQALLNAVRMLDGGRIYGETNSKRGDFGVLNSAAATCAAVVIRGGRSEYADSLSGGRGAHGARQERHRIAVVVFQSRGQSSDEYAYVLLADQVDALVNHLNTMPRLNNAPIKRAQVVEVSDIRRVRDSAWIYQSILVQVDAETKPVTTEGAQ